MLESKRRAIIFFVIAIILAAISGYLVLNKVKTLNADLGTMVNIYVASKDVSSRAIITPDDVMIEEIPKKYVRDEYITDPEFFMNKVSVVPLSEGDIMTKNILKEASSVTEANNRLISILRSDRVFFDEPLTALDRVDLIVSRNVDGEIVTEVFMEDVKVARIAKNDGDFSGVQLEVTFEEAPELIHMHHYAERFRVVKANVGQDNRPTNIENEQSTEAEATDDAEDKDETNGSREKKSSEQVEEETSEESDEIEDADSDSDENQEDQNE
ncbi:flagella basal body P-ring formation protein FlgA [Lentibacillus saliphilus]|uniref:flagella basal body P-ring formation protein FlgA n=1 Tax=Lentibacillus saliphilus TaxID=2737028 RepID=UPI001C30425E|nr:flagella basal body P-ring formation protein FlgA [Lentibacillus saliphilus]